MTTPNYENFVCATCRHYQMISGGCKAFPDGIPREILNGENLHTKPMEGQGNDIVYQEGEPDELVEILGENNES